MQDRESPPRALVVAICIMLVFQVVSALTSIGLCWICIANARELRALQTQTAFINRNHTFINSLANDAFEYSKQHPAIDPILESVGLKPSISAATTGPTSGVK